MTGSKLVVENGDLTRVLDWAQCELQFDIANFLHASRIPLPASRSQQLLHPLLELAVVVQQLLDAPRQVLRLRLQRRRRRVELLSELADQLVGDWARHRLDAADARGRPGL